MNNQYYDTTKEKGERGERERERKRERERTETINY